jgi:hypothetical protein
MAKEEKKTIKVTCPATNCKTIHIFIREDYKGKAFIPFECKACHFKQDVPLPPED